MYIFEKDSSAQIKSEKREKWVIVGQKRFSRDLKLEIFFFIRIKKNEKKLYRIDQTFFS